MEKIRVEDLTFSYDKETNAVEHVSFSIEEGSYTSHAQFILIHINMSLILIQQTDQQLSNR